MKNGRKRMALALALALLMAGCAEKPASAPGPENSPAPAESAPAESAPAASGPAVSAPAENVAPTPSPEELAAVEAAERTFAGFRWPEEVEVRTLAGQEVELVRYHGPGWSVLIPRDWEQPFVHDWRARSGTAYFSVYRWDYPVNNPKIYRAQQGAWYYDTDYPAPFDYYYYDDDGGYAPSQGSYDCVYFFAPAGERSYELTVGGVAGLTTEVEKATLEAMLLSFTQDESCRTLYAQDYRPGRSEWDFAMAGLLAESEELWGSWEEDGWGFGVHGRGRPEYVSYALPLLEFQPGEFVQFGVNERPEGMEEEWPEMITLSLPEVKLWVYFYKDSPWVSVDLAGEKWWTRVSHPKEPGKLPYDTALAWMEAELEWEKEDKQVFQEMPRTYSFLSGAGGWAADLNVDEQGGFTGSYHDGDMGDVGEDYPNGTYYYCDFNGRFSVPEQVDEFTYALRVEEMHHEPAGIVRIKDGMRSITSGPHGLAGAGEVRFYRPGYPIANFTQEERFWLLSAPGLSAYTVDELAEQVTPCWVIQNVDEGMLFFAN